MKVYELDISWAETADDLTALRWQLLACDEVRGVFLTGHEETLAVLFNSDRAGFAEWVQTLLPRAADRLPATPTTTRKGALR